MPKFTRRGPYVPDALVQALEEDRVVLFCGAGVSMGAGLPSYQGLVAKCYSDLGQALPPDKSPEWLWPDRMLGALESRFGAAAVRAAASARLSTAPTDLKVHEAILGLARLREADGLRLVTTNFDTYFEQALDASKPTCDVHSGPVLPIPRDDRIISWRSIAYLHGRLGDEIQNHQLVMTSADFGRAYLTEGWAARFVARLFADFTVLFIGYSLNDPVLRYMTDAFAAEAALARRATKRERAYIFVDYDAKTGRDPEIWRNRGVEPIFFHRERNYIRLRETLIAWADYRSDFLKNTARLISRLAPSRPEALDPSDTDNLVWAVLGRDDDEGLGAQSFAKLPTPPPIAWLREFERRETRKLEAWREDVERAGREKLQPPRRPQLYLAPLTNAGDGALSLPRASIYLAEWLARHLESVEFVEWALEKSERGLRLHPQLRETIRRALQTTPPAPAFALLWAVLSAEGAWNHVDIPATALWGWPRVVADNSAALWMRQELLAVLRPYVRLSRSYYLRHQDLPDADAALAAGPAFDRLADVKVKLVAGDRLRMLDTAINRLPDAEDFLAGLVDDLGHVVRSVCDLFAVFGSGTRGFDMVSSARQSIIPHAQNRDHEAWSWLLDWLWRGWRRVDERDPAASRRIVEGWRGVDYLLFQRLRLAAMTVSENFTDAERMEALLDG